MKIYSSLTRLVTLWSPADVIWRDWTIAKRTETNADGSPDYFYDISAKAANDSAISAWRAAA